MSLGRPGTPVETRRREAAYQLLCAQIMRESCDLATLAQSARRALGHPEAAADSILAGSLQSFIGQMEAELRAKARRREREADPTAAPSPGVGPRAWRAPEPTRPQTRERFTKLAAELDEHLSQYDLDSVGVVLGRLRELRERYPAHVDELDLQEREQSCRVVTERAALYQKQIEELAHQASAAACSGDAQTAAWTLRRLGAINAVYPLLLPAERLQALRDEISHGGDEHAHREAAKALIARERAVAAEIEELAGVIRRFRRLVRRRPHDDDAYLRAHQDYLRAMTELRSHDTEWLAALILDLEALLEDVDDESGRAHEQINRFLSSVRGGLLQLRREIQTVQLEEGPPGESPPV